MTNRTAQRWSRLVSQVSVRALPWQMTIGVTCIGGSIISVVIRGVGPERDEPTRDVLLTMAESVTMETASRMSDSHVIELVSRLVHRFVAHEVDEAFLVNGERYHDPHAAEKAVAA